jgi:two-component system, OmpR family, response regulator RpaA
MPSPTRKDSTLSVLVVDDDPDTRQMYSTYLSTMNCKVYDASDGRTGLDRAVALRPDLIILDLMMPRVDGWTVLTNLRASSWTADIPIVVVSAAGEARDQALCLGADACLTKPCSPEVLWCQIKGLMRVGPHVRHRLAYR